MRITSVSEAIILVFSIMIFSSILGCSTGERGRMQENAEPITHSCQSRCLSGNCQNGTGEYEFADCSTYIGEFEDGLRNGTGEYRFSSGTILKGFFEDGRPAGAFEYRFPEGAIFKGRIRDLSQDQQSGLSINGADGFLEINGERRPCKIRDFRLLCEAAGTDGIQRKKNNRPEAPEDLEADEIKFLLLYAPGSARLLRNDRNSKLAAVIPWPPGIPSSLVSMRRTFRAKGASQLDSSHSANCTSHRMHGSIEYCSLIEVRL
ncbi:MAG: hypothetical protein CMF59_18940 [Leptospiraceae bacterium]|nr:hypothetical protein [Leptospiraceae bacterium]